MQGYRYHSPFTRRSGGSVVLILIAATAGAFILQMLSPVITAFFALDPNAVRGELKLYQLFTYMFLHGGFFHLLINLYVLYIFGSELESLWGRSKFLFYYFASGIGAGIITALLSNYRVVGASGAIYGLLLAYGVLFPNRILLLSFFIPIKAKYAVVVFAALEFFASMSGGGDGIAHITHLGGMVFGGLVLFWWKINTVRTEQKRSDYLDELVGGPLSPANVDRILDKVLREGPGALTKDEWDILMRAGKFYQQKNNGED